MSKAAARVGGEPLRCKDCRWFVTVVAGFECHRLPPGDVASPGLEETKATKKTAARTRSATSSTGSFI